MFHHALTPWHQGFQTVWFVGSLWVETIFARRRDKTFQTNTHWPNYSMAGAWQGPIVCWLQL